jgi:membrane-associated protease RseP (regulator of RpoE activity)
MSHDNTEPPTPQPPTGYVSSTVPRPIPPEQVIVIGRPQRDDRQPAGPRAGARERLRRRALMLFLLTCFCTFLTGFIGDGEPVIPKVFYFKGERWARVFTEELSARTIKGLLYSGCVMAILTAHELGHYLQARRYRVAASLPYFIPFPVSPFGTMGAVIVQQSGVADRKSMFDIAITGPLAGLVVALPVAFLGIINSRVVANVGIGPVFGDPLLLKWMYRAIHGPIPAGDDILLNPMLFAGWVGIFITALNLVPIGQLDGGHILYCLIGRRAHYVARGLFALAACIVVVNVFFLNNQAYIVWWLMLFLIWLFGTRHPPTANDRVRLGAMRIVLGWLALLFVLVGFTPTPIIR